MSKACLGSKAASGLRLPLIGMMPPHDVYAGTPSGGGAIMQRKPPALLNVGIELDARALADFSRDCPVQLIHDCCHAFLKSYPFEGRELAFVDPPCLRSTRKAPERYRHRHDYTEQNHVELIGILKSLPCQIMLSGYRSALHDEWLSDWRRLELQVMNQAGVVTEVVWYNFPIDRLHRLRCGGCPESASGCQAQGGALNTAKVENRLSGPKSEFEELGRSAKPATLPCANNTAGS